MQNRYTGDIGDFGKLGLLRWLRSAGFSIGVNWYLVPDETHNQDGRHVSYLEDESYRTCDAPLWEGLRQIVHSGQREVRALENGHILDATFFSVPLEFSGKTRSERAALREHWHEQALEGLSGVDVVFADPDNGLVVPSAAGTIKENKFVKPDELADYYRNGASVIYYQHKARRSDSFYTEQHTRLIQNANLDGANGMAMKFKTTSQRFYFFIVQPRHKAAIEESLQNLITSSWGNHFCFLTIPR